MHSLNALINQGKVLYLGISDSPAWVVTKANMYARQNGLRPFSVYQGRYSAQERDLEREVIPMCQAEGMAFQPFGVLGGGYFKSPGKEDTGARKIPPPLMVGREEQVSKVLDTVATRHNVPITSVALAYVLQKVSHALLTLPRLRAALTFVLDALRIPRSWGTQGRAPQGQHRGPQP